MAAQLTTNTATLESILTKVQALPEAGSGGVELPTLTNPAEANKVLTGEQYINENGEAVTGTMPNNGSVSTTIDGLNTKTVSVPEGYTSGGTVTVDDTVDNIADNQADLLAQAVAVLGNKASASPKLQNKEANPSTSTQEIVADTGYDGLSKVTVNAMTTATQATPTISVSNTGLITASTTQAAGYVAAGTKSATKQLTTQAAQTITPGTSNKTIASGRYLTGTQTIKGDANLIASNIAEGVSIFGVTGTHSGSDENVETIAAEQATKLAELKGILETKAAGGSGGSVETCSITITSFQDISYYTYTALIDNVITGVCVDGNTTNISLPINLNNVVCGSAIWLTNNYYMNECTLTNGVELLMNNSSGIVIKAPTTAGVTGTADIWDGD